MRDDLRWAVRHARRRPILASTVTATLAVAIASATTAFGLAAAVLWRPLPFCNASRLVFVWEESERDGQRSATRVTAARYAAWRHEANGLVSTSLFGAVVFTIDDPRGAVSVRGVRVSANYFDTIGIRALVGRTLVPDEEQAGNHRVVILPHSLWQERFGGHRDVVAMLVGSRTREMGVRLAIGATAASLAQQVIGDGLRSAVAGTAIGCVLALAAESLLRGLVGVSWRDPITLAAVAGALVVVAVAAAGIPVWRAARIESVVALRAD